MTEQSMREWLASADPTTAEFWAATAEHRLLVQHCADCGHHQLYPRPFCLACESPRVRWREAGGRGRVYSLTTVRVPVVEGLEPPYLLALVELDEGPRVLTNLVDPCAIGDRVELCWDERDGLVLPVFGRHRPPEPTGPAAAAAPVRSSEETVR